MLVIARSCVDSANQKVIILALDRFLDIVLCLLLRKFSYWITVQGFDPYSTVSVSSFIAVSFCLSVEIEQNLFQRSTNILLSCFDVQLIGDDSISLFSELTTTTNAICCRGISSVFLNYEAIILVIYRVGVGLLPFMQVVPPLDDIRVLTFEVEKLCIIYWSYCTHFFKGSSLP